MKSIKLLLLIFFGSIIFYFSCNQHHTRIDFPQPDPLNTQGDTLYAIYRKGIITRHLTKNGRLLETVALESVDDFVDTLYDGSGYIKIKRINGAVAHRIPTANIRYSEELKPGTHEIDTCLWVPVVAPIKNPGYSNNGYYIVSGSGDNPLYYGGMALATFSLEHKYGVSKSSIRYARKMVEYFLSSEMTGRNGYMIRRPSFFDSGRNKNGEPIIQGASPEELLGTMLGLMYYLKAEDPNYPLYSEAKLLRDRILKSVPLECSGYGTQQPLNPDNYSHRFMRSRKDYDYDMAHFAFPLFASKGELLDEGGLLGFSPKRDYLYLLKLVAGTSLSVIESLPKADQPNWLYPMYLTSMILVLDSDIPENEKEEIAKEYMEEFIKAASTSGPDVDSLKNNAYLGLIGKLVNKYLNSQRDSEYIGNTLERIWGDDIGKWRELQMAVEIMIKNARSLYNDSWEFENPLNNVSWQHNLPLLRPWDKELSASIYKDHNPHKRVGHWFVWKKKFPYESTFKKYQWEDNFPGWSIYNFGAAPLNEIQYKTSNSKKYYDYISKEIHDERNHRDNQVEGAGLGLFFLRMLLTHINPDVYPPPKLPEDSTLNLNKSYDVLPWVGVEPMHPQSMYYKFRYWSKHASNGIDQFEIKGDQDQALRLIALGNDHTSRTNFVVAYATEDEKLKLVPGFVSDGFRSGNQYYPEGIYLHSQGVTWKRFDKAVLSRTQDSDGNEYIIVAERAEESGTHIRRKHWLRLSLWKISCSEGHAGNLTFLGDWVQDQASRDPDSIEELDMTIFSSNYIAIEIRTKEEKNKVLIFEIDFNNNKFIEKQNKVVSDELYDHSIGITSAYNNFIIYYKQRANDWRFVCEEWSGNQLQFKYLTTLHENEKLLGLTTVKKLDLSQPDYASAYYLVAVTRKDSYLRIYSWEITKEGRLIEKGKFDTRNAEHYLFARQADWERASIKAVYWNNKPGFVIAGKGVACEVENKSGEWEKSAKGLKVLYGYIMKDGRPTLESSNVIGSGNDDAMTMLDISKSINHGHGGNLGTLTAHKTKDNHLMLVYWTFEDIFKSNRWND